MKRKSPLVGLFISSNTALRAHPFISMELTDEL